MVPVTGTNGTSKDPLDNMGDQINEGTELIHLTYEGNFILECMATVVGCRVVENDADHQPSSASEVRVELQLDRTAMHPQGGGQPTDIGVISTDIAGGGARINIDKVMIDRETNVVTHAGKMLRANNHADTAAATHFEVGSKVHVAVDSDNRRLLSECHTAGHVVDSAMSRCGQMLPPTKGYHFMDGPYVEYRGKIPPEERRHCWRI